MKEEWLLVLPFSSPNWHQAVFHLFPPMQGGTGGSGAVTAPHAFSHPGLVKAQRAGEKGCLQAECLYVSSPERFVETEISQTSTATNKHLFLSYKRSAASISILSLFFKLRTGSNLSRHVSVSQAWTDTIPVRQPPSLEGIYKIN